MNGTLDTNPECAKPAAGLTGPVHVRPADGADLIVRPVDVSVDRIVVDGDRVQDVVELQHDVRVVRGVERDAADVRASGEQQYLLRTCEQRAKIIVSSILLVNRRVHLLFGSWVLCIFLQYFWAGTYTFCEEEKFRFRFRCHCHKDEIKSTHCK